MEQRSLHGFTGAARARKSALQFDAWIVSPPLSNDVDLNALENEHFESGAGAEVYAWLLDNAYDFGFVQVWGHEQRALRIPRREWHWSIGHLLRAFCAVTLTCVRRSVYGF